MSGIHCLVFSKDRPLQLDAFLRSARRYAPYETVTTLNSLPISTRLNRWDIAYEICDHEHRFWGEQWNDQKWGFEKFVRGFLERHERVVFHTDDDVWFREPPAGEFPWPVSFRLGWNTTWCHPQKRRQETPLGIIDYNDWIVWQWRDADGDFGYPLSLNGTVYRSADLLPLLDFPLQNPTQLEAGLAARAGRFAPEWLAAPAHSCCVSLPHNRVSEDSGCPAGANPDWQPGPLLDAFLDGYRLDLDAMDFTGIIGAHQEVPLAFAKQGGGG